MREYIDVFSIAVIFVLAALVGVNYGAKPASLVVFIGAVHEIDVYRRIKEFLRKQKTTD